DSEDSCFRRGSYIELSSGAVRRVEDIRTEDFIQSALRSQLFELREATVVRINRAGSPHHVTITFSYDSQCAKVRRERRRVVGCEQLTTHSGDDFQFQVNMEVLPGHPLFVYGQGWASCDPQLSLQLYELRCQQLQVGDICLSLVPREQPVAPVAPPPPPPVSLHSHEAPAMEYPLLADSPPAGSFGGLPPMRNPYQVYAQMANFVAAYTQHMIDKMQN
ncbi:hypothetical protein KR009_007951, partial [Drosophila setifemur]